MSRPRLLSHKYHPYHNYALTWTQGWVFHYGAASLECRRGKGRSSSGSVTRSWSASVVPVGICRAVVHGSPIGGLTVVGDWKQADMRLVSVCGISASCVMCSLLAPFACFTTSSVYPLCCSHHLISAAIRCALGLYLIIRFSYSLLTGWSHNAWV